MEDKKMAVNNGRRKFIQKAVYVTPAVLTLSAMPFTASYGSQEVSQNNVRDHLSTRGNQSGRNKPYKMRGKSDRWDKSVKWDR
jgi:hypothetical protein